MNCLYDNKEKVPVFDKISQKQLMINLKESDISVPISDKQKEKQAKAQLFEKMQQKILEEEKKMNRLYPNKVGEGKNIPGYSGFVKAVRSENLYGETYGETSLKSNQKDYTTGFDLAPARK